jgi:hypothetical protein
VTPATGVGTVLARLLFAHRPELGTVTRPCEDAMSKKHHGGPGPIPAGNRPQTGPAYSEKPDENPPSHNDADNPAAFQDQDAKRRLGGFETAGEHARQQPSRLNDGDVHSR